MQQCNEKTRPSLDQNGAHDETSCLFAKWSVWKFCGEPVSRRVGPQSSSSAIIWAVFPEAGRAHRNSSGSNRPSGKEGYFFFAAGFIFFWFLVLSFPVSLIFCFSASLLFAFPAPFYFYFYYSTFSFLQSCVFAALLPAPLLLCFLSLLSLCFSFSFALFCLYPKWNPRETLGEAQRNPKEILIRNPTWSPNWTLTKL